MRPMKVSSEMVRRCSGAAEMRHAGLTIHQVLRGNGTVRVGDRSHPLSPDGFLMVQSDQAQCVSLNRADYVRISLPPSLTAGHTFAQALTARDYHVDVALAKCAVMPSSRHGEELFDALLEAQRTDYWPFFLVPNERQTVVEARERMLATLDQTPTLEAFSAQFGYSPFHFQRLFAKAHGLSPSAFLMKEKVRKACRELILRDAPFEHIAKACGYESATTFWGVFKRMTGRTPAEFRWRGLRFRESMTFYL